MYLCCWVLFCVYVYEYVYVFACMCLFELQVPVCGVSCGSKPYTSGSITFDSSSLFFIRFTANALFTTPLHHYTSSQQTKQRRRTWRTLSSWSILITETSWPPQPPQTGAFHARVTCTYVCVKTLLIVYCSFRRIKWDIVHSFLLRTFSAHILLLFLK